MSFEQEQKILDKVKNNSSFNSKMDDMMNLLLQEANSSVYIRTINKNIFD